jgi:trimeric autotransporter adhesin
MKSSKLKRPAPGTVLGLLALIVAVAGNTGAFAGSANKKVTRSDLAKGAVTARALAKGAVTARAIRQGAVGTNALAPNSVGTATIKAGAVTNQGLAANSVTSAALAPGSVYGAALGPVVVHAAPIADLDVAPEISTWTTSNTEQANCAPGERLLSGGVIFTNPGNRRVGIARSLPFSSGTLEGVSGQITSDSNGTAAAEVQAICLK